MIYHNFLLLSFRLYYQIHDSKPEIALTVTPCESTIEWKLSFLPQKLKGLSNKSVTSKKI